MIAAAATEAGVEFVDPTKAFNGHGIGSEDPWFNDISLGGPGCAPVNPGSFHPNAAGQAARRPELDVYRMSGAFGRNVARASPCAAPGL